MRQVGHKENQAATCRENEASNYFDEEAFNWTVACARLAVRKEVSRADLTSVRESYREEIEPQDDLHQRCHGVEKDRHLVDWLRLFLVNLDGD